MLPSLRRAAIRAFLPHREQLPLITRAAHAWQTRPRGPLRGSSTSLRPHSEQPGTMTPEQPAARNACASLTTATGHSECPEVSASGWVARCSSSLRSEVPQSALASCKAAAAAACVSSGTVAVRKVRTRLRRIGSWRPRLTGRDGGSEYAGPQGAAPCQRCPRLCGLVC